MVVVTVLEADMEAAAVQRDCLREAQAMEGQQRGLLELQGRQTLAGVAVAQTQITPLVQTAAVAL